MTSKVEITLAKKVHGTQWKALEATSDTRTTAPPAQASSTLANEQGIHQFTKKDWNFVTKEADDLDAVEKDNSVEALFQQIFKVSYLRLQDLQIEFMLGR